MSLYMDNDDGQPSSIQFKCVDNTIQIFLIFLRIVPFCTTNTNTTTMYKIVCFSFVFNPKNYKGNH